MFLVITKDIMLFNAITHLINREEVLHVQNAEEICEKHHTRARVIIDTLNNNIFHTSCIQKLEGIAPLRVFVFSPFRIKKCLGNIPVTFISRDISVNNFMVLLNSKYNPKSTLELSLSRKQHQILTYILRQKTRQMIVHELRISTKTFHCHKYNIMLLLKLRKMNDLVRHQIASYLT